MTPFDSPENKLKLARFIVRGWKGFSAEVIFYDGSPGVTGQLYILFSSIDDQYFLMKCGACDLFETNFKWQVEQLEINADSESRVITIVDQSVNLKIYTKYFTIDQLLNRNAVSEFCDRVFSQREFPLIFPSLQRLDSLQQLERARFNIPNLNIDCFKAYNNILDIVLRYAPFNKKGFSDYSISLLLRNPAYFYYKQTNIDLNEIKVQQINHIFRITDKLEKYLCVECHELQFCETIEFLQHYLPVEQKINWLSTSTFLNLSPKHIISWKV